MVAETQTVPHGKWCIRSLGPEALEIRCMFLNRILTGRTCQGAHESIAGPVRAARAGVISSTYGCRGTVGLKAWGISCLHSLGMAKEDAQFKHGHTKQQWQCHRWYAFSLSVLAPRDPLTLMKPSEKLCCNLQAQECTEHAAASACKSPVKSLQEHEKAKTVARLSSPDKKGTRRINAYKRRKGRPLLQVIIVHRHMQTRHETSFSVRLATRLRITRAILQGKGLECISLPVNNN